MVEYSREIITLLIWMIGLVGGGLVTLVIWISARLNAKVEEMPAAIAHQVERVYEDTLVRLDKLGETQQRLERDVREKISTLDHRVVRLEVSCQLHHDRG